MGSATRLARMPSTPAPMPHKAQRFASAGADNCVRDCTSVMSMGVLLLARLRYPSIRAGRPGQKWPLSRPPRNLPRDCPREPLSSTHDHLPDDNGWQPGRVSEVISWYAKISVTPEAVMSSAGLSCLALRPEDVIVALGDAHGRLTTHTVLVVRIVRSSRCRTPSGRSLSMRMSSVARSSALIRPLRLDRMRRRDAWA